MFEHENEILGTGFALGFALIVFFFIKFLCFDAVSPSWILIVLSVALGGVALWGLYKTVKYWIGKIKSKSKK